MHVSNYAAYVDITYKLLVKARVSDYLVADVVSASYIKYMLSVIIWIVHVRLSHPEPQFV